VARPTTDTIKNPTYWEVYDLGGFDTAGLDAFIRSQIGKGYDWQGVFFTYGLPLQKQSWDKWTCAELVYFALVHYTPVDLPVYVVNQKWTVAGEKRRDGFSHFELAEKYDFSVFGTKLVA
jgi:hypothetical protein